MRGATQAWLAKASNREVYVVKWAQSPQGIRSLINEVIATALFREFRIQVPDIAFVEVGPELLVERTRFLKRECQLTPFPVLPGLHFGSRVSPDLTRHLVYDILPPALMPRVQNREDFIRTLVLDKWLNNQDTRQAIFYRREKALVVEMIDHGLTGGGLDWRFCDGPLMGLHREYSAYDSVTDWQVLQPTITSVEQLDRTITAHTIEQIPQEWLIDGVTRSTLTQHIEHLQRRQQTVRKLIRDVLDLESIKVFRKWDVDSASSTGGTLQCSSAKAR